MAHLPDTKQALRTFSVPTTVKDAEQLMQEELGLKEKMINLFAESELKMDQFLTSLKGQKHHRDTPVVWPTICRNIPTVCHIDQISLHPYIQDVQCE